MMMAGAGLQRLGMDNYISELIPENIVIPACSQGAIAIEIRENDPAIASLVSAINDEATLIATDAERAFLRTLEGGCQIPVGSYSKIEGNSFEITGFISSINGEDFLKETAKGHVCQAVDISVKLAETLLDKGGREILKAIRLDDPFERKNELPLYGKTFISTRAIETGDTLPDLLTAQGATLLSLPMIEIKQSRLKPAEIQQIKELEKYNWLFFTSRNGVAHFFKQLIDQTGGSELPSSLRVAVVGAKTASELEYYGYKPTFTGTEHGSAELAAEFVRIHNPLDQKILLSLGNLADDTLKHQLGVVNQVDRINVYETCQPSSADPMVIKRISDGSYDLILFTSPSTFSHFASFVDTNLLGKLKIGSIGNTTSRAIMEAGYEPLMTAKMSHTEGLTEAILQYYKQQ
jgi:uroporphyrinogen-III synthase